MAAAQQQSRSTRQAVPASSRVAIIGGGISGLAAAKQLAAHDPVVFEATPSIGGVWKHCVYRSTRLQTPRRDYEFSDYSWRNRDDPTFPTHAEIVEYLEGYADAFGLWRYIVLGARVVDVKFLGGGGLTELWSGGASLCGRSASPPPAPTPFRYECDSLICCSFFTSSRRFGGKPLWDLALLILRARTTTDSVTFTVLPVRVRGDVRR